MMTESPKTLREFLLTRFPGSFEVVPQGTADWNTNRSFTEGQEYIELKVLEDVPHVEVFKACAEFYSRQGFEIRTSMSGGFGVNPNGNLIRNFIITEYAAAFNITVECF